MEDEWLSTPCSFFTFPLLKAAPSRKRLSPRLINSLFRLARLSQYSELENYEAGCSSNTGSTKVFHWPHLPDGKYLAIMALLHNILDPRGCRVWARLSNKPNESFMNTRRK